VNYFIPEEKCDHYSVLRKIDSKNISLFDPWFGPEHKYSLREFKKIWHSDFNFEKEKRWFIAIKKKPLFPIQNKS
jgi:predicted double-glycine peptidase